MAHTIIGVFRHSGDADIAAAHLQLEYALDADELDVISQGETDNLTPPAPGGINGTQAWVLASFTGGLGLQSGSGDEDPIGKRWGDQLYQGQTLVVVRANDPEVAQEIAKAMRETGAERIDLLPH